MKKTNTLLILAMALVLLASCKNRTEITESDESDTYTIIHNNIKRTFIMHLPENYSPSNKYSLCFIFHGGNGNAKLMVDKKFTEKATGLDFIMVYPNGIDGKWDFHGGIGSEPTDIDFISTLTDSLTLKYSVDSSRVYAAGVSMGGVMAYSVAANLSDKFTAISAISASSTSLSKGLNPDPVSILHIHAIDDMVIPYNNSGYSAVYSINKWREINNTQNEAQIFIDKNGIYGESWHSKGSDIVTSLITNDTGGHGALPYTVDFVLDFFYNNPPRQNRISLDITCLKDSYRVNEPIEIFVDIEDKTDVTEMVYTIDGKAVLNRSESHFSFLWIPVKEGEYTLKAFGINSNGEKIHSAIALDLLVVKPNFRGDFIVTASSSENRSLDSSLIADGNFKTRWVSAYSDTQEVLIVLQKITGLSLSEYRRNFNWMLS